MKKISRNLAVLIGYLLIVLNIERVNVNGHSVFNLQPYFYFLLTFSVIAIITIPQLLRLKKIALLTLGILLYAIGNIYFYDKTSIEYPYLTIVEIFLIFGSIFLSNKVATSIKKIENLLASLLLPEFNRKIYEEDNAEKFIENEFSRSRRNNHQLSTMIIEPDISSQPENIALEQILNELKLRYLNAKLTKVISSQARISDMIVRLKDHHRLIIVSPETTSEQSQMFAKRLTRIAKDTLGIDLAYGIASFPQDGQTFSSTREKAEAQLLQACEMQVNRISEQVDQMSE